MDLSRSVQYRGTELNSVTVSSTGITGVQIDEADTSDIEVRQFREPRALQDGHSLGPVYLGGRRIHLKGTVYGLTQADAFDRILALETLFYPTAAYIALPSSFGFAALDFYEVDPVGALATSFDVRSEGLRVSWVKSMWAGSPFEPLAIPWEVTLIARDPVQTQEVVVPPPPGMTYFDDYSNRTIALSDAGYDGARTDVWGVASSGPTWETYSYDVGTVDQPHQFGVVNGAAVMRACGAAGFYEYHRATPSPTPWVDATPWTLTFRFKAELIGNDGGAGVGDPPGGFHEIDVYLDDAPYTYAEVYIASNGNGFVALDPGGAWTETTKDDWIADEWYTYEALMTSDAGCEVRCWADSESRPGAALFTTPSYTPTASTALINVYLVNELEEYVDMSSWGTVTDLSFDALAFVVT